MAVTPQLKCPHCGLSWQPRQDDIGTVLNVVRARRALKQAAQGEPAKAPEQRAVVSQPSAEAVESPFEPPAKKTPRAKTVKTARARRK